MALHPAEEELIEAFVVPQKRERLRTLLGSRKRRNQALELLNHFAHWDSRYKCELPSSANILSVLCQAGAPEHCHVISCDPTLDGRDMPLADAVGLAEWYGFASVLCCVSGQLAFYFDETTAPRHRVLLSRPTEPHARR